MQPAPGFKMITGQTGAENQLIDSVYEGCFGKSTLDTKVLLQRIENVWLKSRILKLEAISYKEFF